MNGLWVWMLYLQQGGTASAVGCSHIATNLGPRAQMNVDLCVDIDLLWNTYKAYILIISTSPTSICMYNL